MESYLPTSDRHAASWIFSDGPSKGSFKCYVTLEGVGGSMPKRYEALRGGGGVTSALRNIIFFANWLVSSRPTRILK